MTDKYPLIRFAEKQRINNPNRKLLLLALIHRGNEHYNLPLRTEEMPMFSFDVDPVELQEVLQVSNEVVATHLKALEGEYIEHTTSYSDPLNWHYNVKLTPLMRKSVTL